MQSILKTEKIFVLADDRERKSNVSFYLKEFGVLVNFKRLEIGDFIISENTCIERKSSDDFVSSIIDGRIFKQAEEMKKCYERPLIIIEGNNTNGRITENAYKGAIASLIMNFGLNVLTVENEKETARMIYFLAKKEQEDFSKHIVIKGKKKPKDVKEMQQFFLSSLPGVSNIISQRMLEKFGSVKNLVNASEKELESIKGLKKKNAKMIYQIFNERW
ncbi:MAG: ERCC4 domain-containing protein [Candidatus Aenigmatarchaeota archaeon]